MKNVYKKLLAVLLSALTLLPETAVAQPATGTTGVIVLASDYDLDSTTYVGCETVGPAILDLPGFTGPSKVSTSGSSTTVARQTSTDAPPFDNVAVGDELIFQYQGTRYMRYVSARADNTSITVNAAIDLSNGSGFYFRKRTCGASSGWVPVDGFARAQFDVAIDQLNVTGGIDVKVECRNRGSVTSPTIVATTNITTATSATNTSNPWSAAVSSNFEQCRAAFKIGSADDGGDLTTNAEKVSVFFTGRR